MPNYPSDEEIDDLVAKLPDMLLSKRIGTIIVSSAVAVFISYTGLIAFFVMIPALRSLSVFIRFIICILELCCMIIVLFLYWKTVYSSPGYESELPHQSDVESAKEGFHYCTRCGFYAHDSSSHCTSCGQCVLNCDHHCFWICNCVGFRNVRYFVLFMYYESVHLLFTSLIATLYLIQVYIIDAFKIRKLLQQSPFL